jgi:serine/threonine-protein kinase
MHREAMSIPGSAQRFTREARAVVKLKSEHVAKVLDVGTRQDGTPYIVMELLEGRDLDALIKERGALSIAEAAEYVLHACDAIAEAHALGIIHRDLKPANLFVTHRADGAPIVKVLDFGVSKATMLDDAQGGVTRTRAIVGSPSYMSPEQLESSRSVDGRADVWSLGVILYEVTSGRLPFVSESLPRLMAAILTEDFVPLRQVRRDVPPAFDALVASCLARHRDRRCPSVADVARALAPFAPPRSRAVVERIEALAGRSSQVSGPSAYTPAPAGTMGGSIVEPDMRAGTAARTPAARPSVVTRAAAVAGALLVVVVLGGGLALRSAARARAGVTPAHADTQAPLPPATPLPAETQSQDSPTASAPPIASSAVTTASATPPPSAKGRAKHTPAVPAKSSQPAYNPLEHL